LATILQHLFRVFNLYKQEHRPVRHVFFRDETIADQLQKNGYCVVDFIDEIAQRKLQTLYGENHRLSASKGGAFFGIFSKDIAYRQRINDGVNNILQPVFEKWFVGYKSAVNTVVVKVPGQSSFIPIHQDGAAIDESKYSSMNIWIPLQDVTSQNGALYVIPRSHHVFLPYRCASVAPLQKDIEAEMYPFFYPIYLKQGQALFFDSRMFHYSAPNLSAQDRVAVVCRIVPAEAPIVAYYKDNNTENEPVEMWECPPDYLITSDSYNDNERPQGCKLIKRLKDDCPPLTLASFAARCEALGIVANKDFGGPMLGHRNFIQEPKEPYCS
jgi:hypothetical protein